MIVYFSASTRNIRADIATYRAILNDIRSQGHVIAYDWVETAYVRETDPKTKRPLQWIDWHIVKEAEGAIESSELLVVEASDSSTFGVGYEVAYALQRRKPILILVSQDKAASSYATGLKDELITFRTYDKSDLAKHIRDFLEENTIKTKDLRFNFVIDRQIHNHLRWKSYKTGKTKAEVLRDLLTKDMEVNE